MVSSTKYNNAPKITGDMMQLKASSDSSDEDGDSLTPLTSFGAEVVPEGQRPVNEYLDMRRSPLFGWASEEVGTQGVSRFVFQQVEWCAMILIIFVCPVLT